ncbi:MAG TPA: hypothetical protein VKH36_16885 [Acidimicrobiia bacterium]|nr:hypothetical protein [Acidimicrobiia bacterium]
MSSSTVGYAAYALIAALAIVWGAITYLRRPGFATPDDVVTRLVRHRFARWIVWALWAFVGWHLFVRGSGAFK